MSSVNGSGSRALQIVRKYHPRVKAVEDADRNIYIEVSGRAAKGAVPAPDKCPLAKACSREMELEGALISRGVCYLVRNGKAERYVPSPKARAMLTKFDKTGHFEPGIYRLDMPPPSQTLEAQQAVGRKARVNVLKNRTPTRHRTHLRPGVRTRLDA